VFNAELLLTNQSRTFYPLKHIIQEYSWLRRTFFYLKHFVTYKITGSLIDFAQSALLLVKILPITAFHRSYLNILGPGRPPIGF
jgi:hypothetical protein